MVSHFKFIASEERSIHQYKNLNLQDAELNPICHLLALLRAHHILLWAG